MTRIEGRHQHALFPCHTQLFLCHTQIFTHTLLQLYNWLNYAKPNRRHHKNRTDALYVNRIRLTQDSPRQSTGDETCSSVQTVELRSTDCSCSLWHCSTSLLSVMFVLLGAFARLRKATLWFIVSVRLEQLGSHWTDFHEIWYLNIFRKSVEQIPSFIKSDKNNRHVTLRRT